MSKIIKVGCGEYRTVYLHDDGTVWATLWNEAYQYMKYPIENVVGVQGGQYTALCWTKEGVAYELETDPKSGGPFVQSIVIPGGVVYGQMFNQVKFLVNGLGDVYYLCEGSDQKTWDQMRLGVAASPRLVLKGYDIKKIAVAEDQDGLLLLSQNDAVFVWRPGAPTPISILLPAPALDIAMARGVYVVQTAKDLLAWGRNTSYVTGILSSQSTSPTSILKYWPIQFPIKQISGSWNALHILDANNDLWSAGDNIMGEVGNGKGWQDWKNYKGADGKTLQPFSWNWLPNQMLQAPVKLDGKWSAVFSGGSLACNHYAINLEDELYSWGRNKKKELGNGRILIENGLDATYPNWENVIYPTKVDPITVKWAVVTKFDPATAPNNASWTPIPPPPPPPPPVPDKKLLGTVGISEWNWKLYNDGSAESHK